MDRRLGFPLRRLPAEWRVGSCLFAILTVCLLTPAHTWANIDTVYVDNTKAFPGGPGNTPDSAYASIKTALDHTGGADKVLAVIGTGKDYRDTATVTSLDGGTNGHPFVLFARGDVTISGADTTTQWSAYLNLWRAKVVGPSVPHQVYALGTCYPEDVTGADLPVGRCRYRLNGDSVYINTGGSDPRSQVAYISQDTPIQLNGVSYTHVIGFRARYSNDDGITGFGWYESVIANCDVRYSWRQGIMFSGAAHVVVRDNVCNDNGSYGIYLTDSDTRCVILRNTASGNDDPLKARGGVNGIRVGSRPDALTLPITMHEDTVEANVAFKNEDSGIEIRHNYVLSRYNQSWDNHDHGFDHLYCTHVTHVGDLAWGNWRDGMSFENESDQHTIKNCVIANNARDPCRNDWEIEVDNSALDGLQSDYNVIWRPAHAEEPADSILINVRGGPQGVGCDNGNCTSYPDSCFGTLARFKLAFTSLEQHSTAAQPTFVDTAAGDFRPLSNSSVIDAADTTVAGWATRDVRGYVRHDYAGVNNSGNPAGTYRDIGPYEFDARPAPMTDLTADVATSSSIHLTWHASGDDSLVGPATVTDLRHWTAPITEATFYTATAFGPPVPGSPGAARDTTVSGLTSCTVYYFGLKYGDGDNHLWAALGDTEIAATRPIWQYGHWTCDPDAGERARLARDGHLSTGKVRASGTTAQVGGRTTEASGATASDGGNPLIVEVTPDGSTLKLKMTALAGADAPGYREDGGGGVVYQTPGGAGGWTTEVHYKLPPGDDWGLLAPDRRGRWIFLEPLAIQGVQSTVAAGSSVWQLQQAQHSRLGDVTNAIVSTGHPSALSPGDTLTVRYAKAEATGGSPPSWLVVLDMPTSGATSSRAGGHGREGSTLPTVFALHQNQPNPFTSVTTFRFDLPRPETVRLDVFDIAGRRVAVLRNAWMPAGRYSLDWNGRDSNGGSVRPGAYLCRMTAGSFRAELKLVILP